MFYSVLFFFFGKIFRSSRKSLDYTKQSLRISIDLGKREEESETWLQVGRIYYLIQEDELADMYLQVRRKLSIKVYTDCFFSYLFFPGPALCSVIALASSECGRSTFLSNPCPGGAYVQVLIVFCVFDSHF